ncbi:MAG: energy-coupling factor transporter ATPase [Firmicutes bacterium]|nr:energy-coupling factor transporter ATPase [Bacillota bacterium]
MEPMIKAEKLKYEYKRTFEIGGETKTESIIALNGIDIEIEKGSFVAVLGHNGSGKSTFAKHINALIKPTDGVIIVNGFDTRDDELVWKIRQSAGMVFQNPDNQIVATIVEEDVAFGPENLGVEPAEIRKRVDEALQTVGMSEFKNHTPSKLSGGQKQRIAIAGILAMKPECIILDEPTAMLDPVGRKDVIETVKRLNRQEGITIVLITHYMEETVDADRVIVIDDGNVVMEGTPREVLVQVDTLKRYGLDVPQATETAYNLRKLGIDIPADILTAEEMVEAICQLKSII